MRFLLVRNGRQTGIRLPESVEGALSHSSYWLGMDASQHPTIATVAAYSCRLNHRKPRKSADKTL